MPRRKKTELPAPVWPDPSPYEKKISLVLIVSAVLVVAFAAASLTGVFGKDFGRDIDRSSVSKYATKPEPRKPASKSKARTKKVAKNSRLFLVTGATGPVRGISATSHSGSSVEITRNRKSTISTTVYLALFAVGLSLFILTGLMGRLKTFKLSKDGVEFAVFSPSELAQVVAAKVSDVEEPTVEIQTVDIQRGEPSAGANLSILASAKANQLLVDFVSGRGRQPDPVERQVIMNTAVDAAIADSDTGSGSGPSPREYRF